MVELGRVAGTVDERNAVCAEQKAHEFLRTVDGEIEASRVSLLTHLVGTEQVERLAAEGVAELGAGHEFRSRRERVPCFERDGVEEKIGRAIVS
ncbi:hypothetical protein HRbin27_01630 [bacterium HR27]|nr:hypothetical protein HRbin27_01630 [bacterium HR27]